jgi:hypothetical protein
VKYTTLIVTAVSAALLLAPGLVSGGNQSRSEKLAPCKQTVAAVAERRQATWEWEQKIDLDKTSTEYKERKTASCAYLRYLKRVWSHRADARYHLVRKLETQPTAAIKWVFNDYANQALDVAWCESRLSVWAENGQYLGLFQMGSSERRIYGHGTTAIQQAEAAHEYFVDSGRDWSPWSCKP